MVSNVVWLWMITMVDPFYSASKKICVDYMKSKETLLPYMFVK